MRGENIGAMEARVRAYQSGRERESRAVRCSWKQKRENINFSTKLYPTFDSTRESNTTFEVTRETDKDVIWWMNQEVTPGDIRTIIAGRSDWFGLTGFKYITPEARPKPANFCQFLPNPDRSVARNLPRDVGLVGSFSSLLTPNRNYITPNYHIYRSTIDLSKPR